MSGASPIDDGGPAFPVSCVQPGAVADALGVEKDGGVYGMSLRDWFAGMAMNAVCCKAMEDGWVKGVRPTEIRDGVVKSAYLFADAMLAERKGNKAP